MPEIAQGLLAPPRRLEAEMSFLPGVPKAEIVRVLGALRAGQEPPVADLPPLAQANVCSELIRSGKNRTFAVSRLAELQSRINALEIAEQVSADRDRAGMPRANLAQVERQLAELRQAHAQILAGALAADPSEGNRTLCDLIERTDNNDAARLGFVRLAVAAWARATASLASVIEEEATQRERHLAEKVDVLEANALAIAITAWAELTAPQRSLEARVGMSHEDSFRLVSRWHRLSVELASKQGAVEAALPVAEALADSFATIEKFSVLLRDHADTCRKLADDDRRRASPALEALETAIEQARGALRLLEAGLLRDYETGVGPACALYRALTNCIENGTGEVACITLRSFACELQGTHKMTRAALSLTSMMLGWLQERLPRCRSRCSPSFVPMRERSTPLYGTIN